jgi:3-oxoacyl-[acyl-carrier protein] reductase
MKDTYLNFVNSPFGARLVRSIGLPKPEVLRRYRADQPEFDGLVAIGAGREPHLLDALAGVIARSGFVSVAHESAGLWIPLASRHALMTGRFEPAEAGPHGRVAALIFDASGIEDSSQLDSAFTFFHDTPRNGRSKGSHVRSARRRGAVSRLICSTSRKAPRTRPRRPCAFFCRRVRLTFPVK